MQCQINSVIQEAKVAENKKRQAQVQLILEKLNKRPEKAFDWDNFEWLSKEWLQKWLQADSDADVPEIDNKKAFCCHNK